jgi:predicted transcriptional regulator YheO
LTTRLNDLTDEEILECYARVVANLKDMLDMDVLGLITNRTHRLHYFRGNKMNVDLSKIGDLLTEEDPKVRAMREGRVYSYVVDEKLFGFPFRSIDFPIRNDKGEVIGCVAIGRSLENEHKIEQITHALASTLEQVNSSIQEVAAGSQSLSQTINEVVHSANESANKIAEINKVIAAISDISNHSNLLGLNAAIEAARAGEQGRGFAVVADEMRKLANQSKESAGMVTEILTEMKKSIEGIITEINKVGGIAENQAAATEEITAAIQEVGENSKDLAELAKIE